MKRNILIILLMAVSTFGIAQNCAYERNEIDKFSGKMSKLTKKRKLIETFNSEGFVKLEKMDTTYSLQLSYRASFQKNVTVNEGAELSFLLESGKIVTLKKTKGNYAVNSGQLKTLMQENVKILRYYYTDASGTYKYQDTEIKKDNAEDFINLIKCIL